MRMHCSTHSYKESPAVNKKTDSLLVSAALIGVILWKGGWPEAETGRQRDSGLFAWDFHLLTSGIVSHDGLL